MKKYFVFLLLNFSVAGNLFAQKEDRNWVFGDSCGINFNNLTNPFFVFNHSSNNEACASISDKNGNRIFNISIQSEFGPIPFGRIINKDGNEIESGDSLNFYFSSTNGSLFLPFPNDTTMYYCFYLSYNSFCDSNQVLYYSVIDKTLDSGRGKVINKNVYVLDSLTEKLLAIKHANGRDWWLLTRKFNSDTIIKFLISPSGISEPLCQEFGSRFYTYLGENAVSKDGGRICYVSYWGNIDLYDFDRCSGTLSNYVELGTPPYDYPDTASGYFYYGCAFSPDANRLYVGRFDDSPAISDITQFTINEGLISSTKILDSAPSMLLSQFELASDDKIYISGMASPGTIDSSYKYLSVIENPNDSGLACNLNLFSFYLNGYNSSYGLPNMPNYNLSALDGTACDTLGLAIQNENLKTKSIVSIFPNPATNEIKITNLSPSENQISLFNLLGQQVKSIRVSNVQSTILPVADLPAGMYVVTIFDGEKIVCKKFVKE